MMNTGYNGTGGEGLLAEWLAGFFGVVANMAAKDNRVPGVALMSLTDGTFNATASEGSDFYTRSARVDMPDDIFESEAAISEGLLDTFLDRSSNNVVRGPTSPSRDMKASGPDAGTSGPKDGVRLQAAWNNAKGFQGQTAKLRAGDATVSSGQGARKADQNIQAKGEAVKEMKGAIAEARGEQAGPAAPSSGGGAGGLAKNVAVSAAVGVAAEAIMPGGSTVAAVAAIGAGTFGAKSKSEFSSAADQSGGSVYSTSSGHETVDVMNNGGGAPVVTGRDFDNMMSRGPGFGPAPTMGEIRYIVEPSLDETKPVFDADQLEALEATVMAMEQDFQMGSDMFAKWEQTNIVGIDLSEVGDTPMAELKIGENDAAALTSDAPELQEKPITLNPMKIA